MTTHADVVRQIVEGRDAVRGYRIVSGAMTVKEAFKLLGNIDHTNAQRRIVHLLELGSGLTDESVHAFVVASVYSLLINGIYAGIGLTDTVDEGGCVGCINQCWERDKVPPKHGVCLSTLFEAVVDRYKKDAKALDVDILDDNIKRMRVMIAKGV